MGIRQLLRQLCCFASADNDLEPSRPAPRQFQPQPSFATRQYRRRLADMTSNTDNPFIEDLNDGGQTLHRCFNQYFEKPVQKKKKVPLTFWTEYQELPPLDPRERWS